jgi:hypothetical protein
MYRLVLGVLLSASLSFGNVITNSYTFTPSPDLTSLPHDYAYSWGIDFQLGAGEKITGATLQLSNVYNWQDNEWNALFVDLLDNASVGVTPIKDNDVAWVEKDQFQPNLDDGTGIRLDRLNWNTGTNWGGLYDTRTSNFDGNLSLISSSKTNVVNINFTTNELAKLTSYIQNGNNFGFGVDADCHFYTSGVKFTMNTETKSVPEPSIISLLGFGLLGLLAIRRKK